MIDIVFWIVVFILSLGLLIYSSDWFVKSAEDIGFLLNFSPFVIGVLIVSIGTSLPELISSLFAVFQNTSEIVVGNATGSNIANILLVLGISAIFAKKTFFVNNNLKRDIIYMLFATGVVIVFALDSSISIFEGIILTLLLFVYIYKQAKSGGEIEVHKVVTPIYVLAGILLLSVIGVFVSAKFTVDSAIKIGSLLGIPYDVISASAIALGTSLPELFVSVAAARKGKMELAVGNVLGSNAFNMLGVIGIPALFGGLVVAPTSLFVVIPVLVFSSLLFAFFVYDHQVKKYEGWVLLVLYVAFITFLFM